MSVQKTKKPSFPGKMPLPRVMAIHDLSGYSHTSLMAVIPLLNTMQINVSALPTAVLSSNTEHPGFEMSDCTNQMIKTLNHWNRLGLNFDAIYSGFLHSEKQVLLVNRILQTMTKRSTLKVVDPVMADNGCLYDCFGTAIIKAMQRLIKQADIITPNLTEAAFLLNEPYFSAIDESQLQDWCRRLAALGPKQVVITNVPVGKGHNYTSVLCYDNGKKLYHKAVCRYLPVNYPGTGDIFTTVLTGLLLKGRDLFSAIDVTVQFVSKAIKLSLSKNHPEKEGVSLELALHYLRRL